MKKITLIASILVLSGCEQQYRYPCQDPSNWETEQCKKPLCEVNRDCPEYILAPESAKKLLPSAPASPPAPRKDCCK